MIHHHAPASRRSGLRTLLAVSTLGLIAVASPLPAATPASVKYSDHGAKPGTGRSGSASLEVRALIAKDHSTQVEATTGSLETGTRPGNIDKIQAKVFSNPLTTQNFNGLKAGGYWSNTFSSLARGTQVQIQANVSGINVPRTDVVTVTAAAALRPDLKVKSVKGPATIAPNSAATFIIELAELNGDVGARTDCVVRVNGAVVGQIGGLWVDSGDAVSATFTQAFAQPGTYTVSVTAANVSPGDWDTANNAAATEITVVASGAPLAHGAAFAEQDNITSMSHTWDYWGNTWDDNWVRNASVVQMNAQDPSHPDWFGGAEIKISNNGTLNSQIAWTQPSYSYAGPSWDGQHYYQVAGYIDASGNNFLSAVVIDGTTTTYSLDYLEGKVIYYGQWVGFVFWDVRRQGATGVDYGWQAGSTVRLQVNVEASDGAHTLDRSIPLVDQSSAVNYSTTVGDWFQKSQITSSGFMANGIVVW